MKKFCANCGASLNENSQFCPSCGAKALHPNPVNESSPNPPTIQQENTSTVSSTEKTSKKDKPKANKIPAGNPVMAYNTFAPAAGGEMSFVNSQNPSGYALTVLSPVKCITDGFLRIIRSLKTVFQDKKCLIPALVLGVIWIVLMLLPKLGFNPLPVKILSALTFAQGGFSNDILRAVGGIIGKGIFATFFLSLFSGGNALKGYGKGFKMLFSSLKSKNPNEIASLIVSMGLGLILFNFISGLATIWNSMAGIAAFFLMFRSLGRKSGFFRSLAASLTAKKANGVKAIDPSLLNRITSGIAIGLFLSVPLCNIPFVYLPYCVGAAAILAGIVIKIVSNGSKKQVAASLLLFAYSLTLLFPLAASAGKSDDDWAGTWTLKEIIVDDKSDGLSAYYATNPDDLTVENVKITDSSYEHEFRYIGEEYISDIVELEDGEYVPIHYYAGEFFKTKITFDKPPKYLRE
ncbi:MAG: zinc ribbon domain-containing protein, partial [Ruminiclostridium sp.]|nr:zinc ribbon domain-containing protein [Ruminiclostridium sp.]